MKQLILFFLALTSVHSFAQSDTKQTCDCKSNFEWIKKTFEENDAGFEFVIENKGEDAYQEHNEEIIARIKDKQEPNDCAQVISEWLSFFRAGHIYVQYLGNNAPEVEQSEADIIERYKNSETQPLNIKKFEKYLADKSNPGFEGVWVTGNYEIGIKKVGDEYIGSIISADGVYWKADQVKLKINPEGESVFYMRDHSPLKLQNVELVGKNYMEIGPFYLERKTSIEPVDQNIVKYFKAMDSYEPYFETIDPTTVALRIPSFRYTEKAKIDSVINANRSTILSTKNLVLDIRNNGGGSDNSYEELIPFMYTNPIYTVGVEMYSTELNNQRMKNFMEREGVSEEDMKWLKESYEQLSNHLGEFINLNEHVVSGTILDTIYPFPQNVAVIINENCGSTSEQFLLAAKQSKKVKLFGTTTAGVLDISNMHTATSPDGAFLLGYCLSKSMRIPGMTIDGKGIQPDYYMNRQIPKHEWISHTTEILNN